MMEIPGPEGLPQIAMGNSGGFELYLPTVLEDMQQTLVFQAMADHPQIPGATLIASEMESSTRIKTVLFRLD